MMHPFMQLADGTHVEHSQIVTEKGKGKILIYFEREKDGSYDSAKCEYPKMFWNYIEGFTNEEIAQFEKMLKENAHLLPRLDEKIKTGDMIKV